MLLIKPSIEILALYAADNSLIEIAGRTCYKSEMSTDPVLRNSFIERLITRGHESVIEHSMLSVRFICDRGVSHELVRHRLASFSQESTRYCNYKNGVTFIIPPWVDIEPGEYKGVSFLQNFDSAAYYWLEHMIHSETSYLDLLDEGNSPQQARGVLPNATKTELIMTANFREWRHIFKLRTAKAAHPQMRELTIPLLEEVKKLIPVIFDDILVEE
jgi:thymidylate synthase (FAD)